MIFDIDILIWYFRGNENAKAVIEAAIPFSVSAITLMELLQGAKSKMEQRAIKGQLRKWGVKVIHVDEAVSIRAVQLVNDFSLSHSMAAMDAMIAATAIEQSKVLRTGNIRHFDFIPALSAEQFIPYPQF